LNRRLIIPGVILIILILGGLLRWNTEAQIREDGGVVTWKRDRWTGDLWMSIYSVSSGSGEVLASIEHLLLAATKDKEKDELLEIENEALRKRNMITTVWYALMGIAAVWFTMELLRHRVGRAPGRGEE